MSDWGEGKEYFWVVLCKNRGVHNKYNLFSSHAIPLAETDAVSEVPQISAFAVRCDDCGEENSYEAKDILRGELEPPGFFTPHPLFKDWTPTIAVRNSELRQGVVSGITKSLIDRVKPYLRFRQRDTPPPRWRK